MLLNTMRFDGQSTAGRLSTRSWRNGFPAACRSIPAGLAPTSGRGAHRLQPKPNRGAPLIEVEQSW